MTDTRKERLLIALAGQQNAGKSTLFNALTGVHQHIANYPGVTVDKKSGAYTHNNRKIEVIDLPGAYSLTWFSLEERVVRTFLFTERPDVVVNVLDATNLRRGLYLTFQMLEAGMPVVVVLNMIDVAEGMGLKIDADALSKSLGVPVVTSIGRKGKGVDALRHAIEVVADADYGNTQTDMKPVSYGMLELMLDRIEDAIPSDGDGVPDVPVRWTALKLMENDEETVKALSQSPDVLELGETLRAEFEDNNERQATDHIVACRDAVAVDLMSACVAAPEKERKSITEKVDKFLLNRWMAPFFLLLTIWVIYELSIVQGYELTKVVWPFLASVRNIIADALPAAGFLYDPQIRAMGLWLVDSAITLLNYVPIFLILFALIAILEDSGYMARIAFILDRILHRFGLHGQSTLPFILAGVFAGGCAVPGVMATKGIPDQRARLATILTVPFMNCLAKVPLYTLLINIYFVESKGLILFYLSTITVIAALLVAKLLSVSILRGMETAPFIMELPHYHTPTFKGVVRRSLDRTWLYIRKVGTVVIAVAAVIYVLLQFPGLTDDRAAHFEGRAETAIAKFYKSMRGNPLVAAVAEQDQLIDLVNVYTSYKAEKLNAGGVDASKSVDDAYQEAHPDFFPFLKRSKDKNARKAIRALKTLANDRKTLRREIKNERIVTSFLGQVGRGLEPVTQFANFDWKINVALLSSFAARESSVATLGVLFEQEEGENKTLEERMKTERSQVGYGALTAVAVMLFFALYPPCLATTIMVRVQTASYKWMTFSIVFPTFLGLGVASLTYTVGNALGLTGIQAMSGVYAIGLVALLLVGFFKRPFGVWLSTPRLESPTQEAKP